MRSLRVRFVVAFALFGALLTATYGTLTWMAVHTAEDLLMERWLDAEVEHVEHQHAERGAFVLPRGRFIGGTADVARLPLGLRNRVEALPVGAHELKGDGESQWKLRILQPSEDAPRLYLYVNESDLEASEAFDERVDGVILGFSIVVALVGAIVGMLTTRRVIAPLRRLTRAVASHEPDGPLPQLRPLVSDDELGSLAADMERALSQVAASARQEQLFGRYTSHELRSSLAVASGVSELLSDLDEPRLARPLARLDRSIQDMRGIIETCLWLARSQGQMPPAESVELEPLVSELTQRLQGRASPSVTLTHDVPSGVVVHAPRLALRMILTNLLSNALRHTVEGQIRLLHTAQGIEVVDTGPGIPADILERITEPYVRGPGDGHGLGLAIVHGLCGRLGWQLEVESVLGEGTTARVVLGSAP
ncbi:MAG: HAMP domain-containing sensor histidine kinase [Myxococcota bacterium]